MAEAQARFLHVEALGARAAVLRGEAAARLAEVPRWAPAADKEAAWALEERASEDED